jgi:hypothetical protein
VEDGKTFSNNKTWQRKQYGSIQIPSNYSDQHWREGTRENPHFLIKRINHHMCNNELLIDRKYGFMPHKSTTDAAMEVKKNHRTGNGKQESGYNDQPRRQKSFRRSVVAKHPKGTERFRMP